MIFSVWQIQEKCIKQQKPLYQFFVDLTKAFDTINRAALLTSSFGNMFKELYRNMKAYVTFQWLALW